MKKSVSPDPRRLVRPQIRRLHAYVPGEQPHVRGLVKLNTNENPHGPSPRVIKAIRDAVDDRLRLYPNPRAQGLRDKLARFHGCDPAQVIIGNGSDDLLALATRAFVEPAPAAPTSDYRSRIQFFHPSYSLYPVLAEIHGAHANAVPLGANFALPSVSELKKWKQWDFRAALTFITTPNAPSGTGYATADLEAICQAQKGVVILDEAYVDFARENALDLTRRYAHVLVSRTFSKAYSLCFQRIGYLVGHPDLIGALDQVRDSFNVNGLGQVGALATLSDLRYYRANFRRIIALREQLSRSLTCLGFRVFPSQTNFLLVIPPVFPARQWMETLRERKILVRWFQPPEVNRYLRITIGTEIEIEKLLRAVRSLLPKG